MIADPSALEMQVRNTTFTLPNPRSSIFQKALMRYATLFFSYEVFRIRCVFYTSILIRTGCILSVQSSIIIICGLLASVRLWRQCVGRLECPLVTDLINSTLLEAQSSNTNQMAWLLPRTLRGSLLLPGYSHIVRFAFQDPY